MLQALLDWLAGVLGGKAPEPQPPVQAYIGHSHIEQNILFVNDPETGWLNDIGPAQGDVDITDITPLPLVGRASLTDTADPIKIEAGKANRLDKGIIIGSVISVEAGYVNHPSDKGGETNLGITKAVAEANKKMLQTKFKWDGSMKTLTYDMAFAIYEEQYWKTLRLDDIVNINPLLADKLFDIAVNCGVSRAGIWLKTILNILNRQQKDYPDIDATTGYVGDTTIKTIKSLISKRGMNPAIKALLTGLVSKQGAHYIDICVANPKNEDFAFGWVSNRMHHNLKMYFDILK